MPDRILRAFSQHGFRTRRDQELLLSAIRDPDSVVREGALPQEQWAKLPDSLARVFLDSGLGDTDTRVREIAAVDVAGGLDHRDGRRMVTDSRGSIAGLDPDVLHRPVQDDHHRTRGRHGRVPSLVA